MYWQGDELLKCKSCAGQLVYGTYGKVKCEYCGEINDVPLPQQSGEPIVVTQPKQSIEKRGSRLIGIFKSAVIIFITTYLGLVIGYELGGWRSEASGGYIGFGVGLLVSYLFVMKKRFL